MLLLLSIASIAASLGLAWSWLERRHRLALLPMVGVWVPFGLAAAAGLSPPPHAGWVGAAMFALAAWKIAVAGAWSAQSSAMAATIGALFLGVWLREASLYGWSAWLAAAPVLPVALGVALAIAQPALRLPGCARASAGVCALASAGLLTLTLS